MVPGKRGWGYCCLGNRIPCVLIGCQDVCWGYKECALFGWYLEIGRQRGHLLSLMKATFLFAFSYIANDIFMLLKRI